MLFAALFAYAQNHLSLLPSGFNIDETVLRSLATVNDETIAVAFVAGIAASSRSRRAPVLVSASRSP